MWSAIFGDDREPREPITIRRDDSVRFNIVSDGFGNAVFQSATSGAEYDTVTRDTIIWDEGESVHVGEQEVTVDEAVDEIRQRGLEIQQ